MEKGLLLCKIYIIFLHSIVYLSQTISWIIIISHINLYNLNRALETQIECNENTQSIQILFKWGPSWGASGSTKERPIDPALSELVVFVRNPCRTGAGRCPTILWDKLNTLFPKIISYCPPIKWFSVRYWISNNYDNMIM